MMGLHSGRRLPWVPMENRHSHWGQVVIATAQVREDSALGGVLVMEVKRARQAQGPGGDCGRTSEGFRDWMEGVVRAQ